jgi:hypothetical protein
VPVFFVSVLRFFSREPAKVTREEVYGPPAPVRSN